MNHRLWNIGDGSVPSAVNRSVARSPKFVLLVLKDKRPGPDEVNGVGADPVVHRGGAAADDGFLSPRMLLSKPFRNQDCKQKRRGPELFLSGL
jgi:hypothetical protein